MAKKERLGSDPFKKSSLDWIHDTREEKKDSKELKKQKPKTFKRQNVKALKRFDVKTSKSSSVKALKQDKIKKPDPKRRHTIYLSSKQSKKLKVYAADNDMQLSEVIEKLINENI
ncbi:MAG: hypothetical protein L6305_07470 [Actinomycetia bacterium]|nr:hypothetical protein [Actinomycetes bacterium]